MCWAIGAPHPKVRCWSDSLVSHQQHRRVRYSYWLLHAQHMGRSRRRHISPRNCHFGGPLFPVLRAPARACSCVITNNDGVFVYKSRVQSADKSGISNCCQREKDEKCWWKSAAHGISFSELARDASGKQCVLEYNITHTPRKRDINDLDCELWMRRHWLLLSLIRGAQQHESCYQISDRLRDKKKANSINRQFCARLGGNL